MTLNPLKVLNWCIHMIYVELLTRIVLAQVPVFKVEVTFHTIARIRGRLIQRVYPQPCGYTNQLNLFA